MHTKVNLLRGITFDGKRFWSFDNDTARNVMVFGVDNSSELNIFILTIQKNVLVLGKGPTESINGSVGAAKTKTKIKIVLALVK